VSQQQPRLFVAVPLPDPARQQIAALVDRVRARVETTANAREAVRWVRMDGLHLTLRFLGPLPEEDVAGIAAAVAEAASGRPPFGVEIAGGGAFPSAARPRTIWLAVTAGADDLAGLAADLDGRLEPLGWPRQERPFRAHLTLARADGRRARPRTAAAVIEEAASLQVAFAAERVTLFESITGGGPARYEPRHEAVLGRPRPASETSAADRPVYHPSSREAGPVSSVPDRRSSGSS
jgi:2'-5' RNA ligase